jgi:uncharacterized membrane protein
MSYVQARKRGWGRTVLGFFAYFSYLLVIDEQINAFAAIARSFRLVSANFGMALLVYFWIVLSAVLTVATLGIAGIWLFPFMSILLGLAYRDANGIRNLSPVSG